MSKDMLNFDKIEIKRNKNDILVVTGYFRNPIHDFVREECSRYLNREMFGIKVSIGKNTFQVFHLKEDKVVEIGRVIARITKLNPSLFDRFVWDIDDDEQQIKKVFRRKK